MLKHEKTLIDEGTGHSTHTGPELPVITGVYDPVSRKRDGTITSQAPVIVTGNHLNLYDIDQLRLCLVPMNDHNRIYEVPIIYKYSTGQIIVTLPCLQPGIYHPAIRLLCEGEDAPVHVLPNLWVVNRERSRTR